MSGEIEFTVQSFELHDTGIGQEAGYEDDNAFRAAIEAERAAMPPEERRIYEMIGEQMDRLLLYGPGA